MCVAPIEHANPDVVEFSDAIQDFAAVGARKVVPDPLVHLPNPPFRDRIHLLHKHSDLLVRVELLAAGVLPFAQEVFQDRTAELGGNSSKIRGLTSK